MQIRRTVLVAVAAVVLLPAGASARTAGQAPWSTVSVPTGGFSIEVPTGWATATSGEPDALARLNAVLRRSPRDEASLVAADATRQGIAIMDVAVERQYDNSTPTALANVIATAFERATRTRMAQTTEKLPAGAARVLRASLEVSGQERSVAIYLFLRSDVAYLVSYVTTHPEDTSLIAHSARSFAFLEPPDLSTAVLRAAQVGAGYKLRQYKLGHSFIGQETLDLCAGSFPSEGLRTGRLQVTYLPPKRHVPISNEVVSYVPGGAQQALAEVERVLGACSRHPVVRGTGADRVTFRARRLALPGLPPGSIGVSLTIVVGDGRKPRSTLHSVAVYQISRNMLSGVYVFAGEGTRDADLTATARRAAKASSENLRALGLAA